MKKKLFCFFFSFVFAFAFIFSFLPLNIVSAASSFPDTNYVSNFSESQSINLLDQFYSNTSVINRGFDKYNSVICISFSSVLQLYNILCIKEGSFQYVSSFYYYRENKVCSSLVVNRSDSSSFIYGSGISSISSFDFSVNSSINPTDDYVGINFAIPYNDVYFVSTLNSSNNYKIADTPFSTTNWLYNYGIIPPFVPSDFPLYGLDLSINSIAFRDWIIENDKLSELPSYITSSKLLSFIDFYSQFGGSFSNFLYHIPDWFSHMNIANQTSENVNILKSSIDRLYQEYLNSFLVTVYPNTSNQAHHRRNINTQTDDDDLTLVTDDPSDPLDISLLRDILRALIALQVTVSDGHRAIIDALNNINFSVIVSNNGGTPQIPDLPSLFTPSSDAFDDLEDTFFEKFPFLLELESLPELNDYLEAPEPFENAASVNVLAASSDPEPELDPDPLKSRDDLFRFTVPEGNSFMNGSLSGLSIDFASFTKFSVAIEALKGIISVVALFAFSHWLIKFAPKLLNGYAAGD